MTRIILSGANGTMGRVVARCAAAHDGCEIVAGIDLGPGSAGDLPVFRDPEDCDVEADVILDFSHPSALEGLLAYALNRRIPIVIATTGLDANQVDSVKRASKQIPVFFSANMSLGVNLLLELALESARVLGDLFDIEIVERHHNQKIDAPSGTALMLAEAINGEMRGKLRYEYDRHAKRVKRTKNEIGLHSIRGGSIAGDHDIIFAGQDELLTLSHHASSKEVFANGALNAAIFLHEQPPGLYNMARLIQRRGVARMDIRENVNLITLSRIPRNKNVLADIFERFAINGIDIDMVSQAGPSQEDMTISFTCSSKDTDLLEKLIGELRELHPDIRSMISHENCKIVLSGSVMKDSYGVFSRAVAALAPTPAEILQITTAETEISLLVASSHLMPAAAALKEAFHLP